MSRRYGGQVPIIMKSLEVSVSDVLQSLVYILPFIRAPASRDVQLAHIDRPWCSLGFAAFLFS